MTKGPKYSINYSCLNGALFNSFPVLACLNGALFIRFPVLTRLNGALFISFPVLTLEQQNRNHYTDY